MTNLITVDKDKLTKLLTVLLEIQIVLEALESGGVDNWEWYEEALDRNDVDGQTDDAALQASVENAITDLLPYYHDEVTALLATTEASVAKFNEVFHD